MAGVPRGADDNAIAVDVNEVSEKISLSAVARRELFTCPQLSLLPPALRSNTYAAPFAPSLKVAPATSVSPSSETEMPKLSSLAVSSTICPQLFGPSLSR
jgi:hypothetical protein